MIYKCRIHGKTKDEWEEVDTHLLTQSPRMAAELFAEECGVMDGEIIDVFKHGSYRITVIEEPEYYAKKVKK